MRKILVPGINIQYPISRLILEGEKVIETRTYPVPEKYLNVTMAVIETPGKKGNFDSRVIGLVKFTKCFQYKSKSQFQKDVLRHKVETGSVWDWKDGPKWGWEVVVERVIDPPQTVQKQKGIKYTKDIAVILDDD